MGVQSAAVRASDIRGVNTTYMTSTLLNAIARVITRLRARAEAEQGPGLPASAWGIYAIGALIGAQAENAWGAGVTVIPLSIVTAVALLTACTLLGNPRRQSGMLRKRQANWQTSAPAARDHG